MDKLTPEQVDFAHYAVVKWMQTCEDVGRGTRAVDASHSSLLRRLLMGLPLLEVPPPKAFSYPAYDMVEKEECQIHELRERDDRRIWSRGEEYLTEGPVVVIDQCAEYVWEDKEKKIITHVPTGLRWEYFEKTAYPVVVAVGTPEDHPYVGKFLKRLPDRYTLNRSFFMGAGAVNEPVKNFGTIKAVKEYVRSYAVDCEWSYVLYDNVLGKVVAWNEPAWEKNFGLYRIDDLYVSKEEYDGRLKNRGGRK